MAHSLRVQVPVVTIAIPPFANERRVMIGHFEDWLTCYEVDKEDAPLVAHLVLTGERYPLDVRKLGDQFYLQITDVNVDTQVFPFERRTTSNLFSDGSVHRMFIEAFEAVSDLESLKERWDTLPEKPLSNLRRMRLRDIDEALVKIQIDNWQDFLMPPVLIDGRLYRPCDEPFIELAVEDRQTCCSLFVDRDWCSHDTYAVYSLREFDAVKPMSSLLRQWFGGPKPVRNFKITLVEEEKFSANFFNRRFGIWGAELSRRLGWVAPSITGRLKFASELTPAHQSALREIDRAMRSADIWNSPDGTDAALRAITAIRHDPHFEFHMHSCADWADILIQELDSAPIKMPFGLGAKGIGLGS